MKLIAGMLDNNGRILIVQNKKPYDKDYEWFFPTTPEEDNTSPRKVIKNLFQKDFNLSVDISGDPIKFVPGTDPEEIILYPLKISGGFLKSTEKYEIVKWIEPKEIPRYISTRLSFKLSKFLKI